MQVSAYSMYKCTISFLFMFLALNCIVYLDIHTILGFYCIPAVPPNITTLPSAQDIYKSVSGAGVSVRLECMATGLPHPNIFWLKDGHPIAQHLFNNKSGLLQVTRNDFSDGELLGLYQCFAENSVGVQSATVRVLAEGTK